MASIRMSPYRRHLLAGAAATAASLAAPAIVRAQGSPLKIGVLLPRSGFEAGSGQDNQRADRGVAPAILKSLGLPDIAVMNAVDTASNIEESHASGAEKLIGEGACTSWLAPSIPARTTVIAQVAEQKGIPFVINVAAAPDITEQGYKFVFRSFLASADEFSAPPSPTRRRFSPTVGVAPKTVVYMHINDTFGAAMAKGIGAVMSKFDMPYKIVDRIAYDPQARDLSVEVAKAKASNPDALMVTSRLNDSNPDHAGADQDALDAAGDHEHGTGLDRGPISQDAGKILRRSDGFQSVAGPTQEVDPGARSSDREGLSGRRPEFVPCLFVRSDAYGR